MENDYTSARIDRLAEKAVRFLSTTSQVETVRALLSEGGYTEEEHRRGWELTLELLGYTRGVQGAASVQQATQRAAMAELDQWDGPAFDRARAALDHRFPAQSAYVFDGLTAKTGAEAIGSVATFLERVVALREGTDPARTATRDEDRAAAELLAQRRILTAAEETRLRALIAEATRLADLPAPPMLDPSRRTECARTLDGWLRDWRETARVLVTRRDYQIRLGLAERRAKDEEGEPGPVAEA